LKKKEMAPVEIRSRGLKALAKALGPVGIVRSLQQFDTGSGDYMRERDQWLGKPTVWQIVEEIKGSRGEWDVEATRCNL